LALASDAESSAFAPEPVTYLYQRSVYQSMRTIYLRVLDKLRQHLPSLPAPVQADAQRVLNLEGEIGRRFRYLLGRKFASLRLRCHGDYNLGEILYTGKDFMIIDLEGLPSRSLADRRLKRSPLRDVASMVRSFHYAASSALLQVGTARGRAPGVVRPEDVPTLEPWAWTWQRWVAATFVKAYLAKARDGAFLPPTREEMQGLFDVFLLEKALLELAYELDNQRASVTIPLKGLLQLLESPSP
jgi:maltose alpha-D-glucosyltransferase/alpha-amylase